jgi:DNA mismatch repair ATPase MutS
MNSALLDAYGAPSPHTVLVATHDGELIPRLRPLYTPWHFREMMGPEGLSFDYRRHPGAATTRTAIALLEASGAPNALVEAARARADEIDAGTHRSD